MAVVAVVNDMPEACEVVARVLESDGHTAHRLGTAADAEALVSQVPVDVVVLDLQGSAPANRSLLTSLRQRSELEPAAVVVGRSPSGGLLAFGAGADAYVVRPFHERDLRSAVAEVVARPAADRPAFRADAVHALTTEA